MMTISKLLLFIYFYMLSTSVAMAACLPSMLVENTIKNIDMVIQSDHAIESSSEQGNHADMIALRLSRQYYEITIIHSSQSTNSDVYMLGMVKADTTIIDGNNGTTQRTSFIAKQTGGEITLLCADDSILSDQLLHADILQTLQRTNQKLN